MKAWTARTRKDKAARVLASIGVIAILSYGTPRFVGDTYDWLTADQCRVELAKAIDAGIAANSAISGQDLDAKAAATAYATGGRHFAAAVAAPRCPLSIAQYQDELSLALTEYAAVQDQHAASGKVSSTVRLDATRKVVRALEKVYPLIGMESPT